MKRALIKSICLTLLWCGITQLTSAQGIVVNKKDGTKVYYKASEVKSVGVYGYGEGPVDTTDDHEYVDLGLPSGTLWATTNIGAEKPEDYGDYFAWGETIGYNGGKTTFNWDTYKYCKGSNTSIWKYCTQNGYGTVDILTVLEPADDAATANWGEAWHMPSLDQFEELINTSFTTTTCITENDVNGLKITSKSNQKSIFLPCAGFCYDSKLSSKGNTGHYWSRSLDTDNSRNGMAFFFFTNDFYISGNFRNLGNSVRPVRAKK